jgi:hypothetical protein
LSIGRPGSSTGSPYLESAHTSQTPPPRIARMIARARTFRAMWRPDLGPRLPADRGGGGYVAGVTAPESTRLLNRPSCAGLEHRFARRSPRSRTATLL